MKIIKIVTHYSEDDPQFYRDYYCIEVFIDEVKVKHYGDHYHDKGRDKVDGFLDALCVMDIKHLVIHEYIADGMTRC